MALFEEIMWKVALMFAAMGFLTALWAIGWRFSGRKIAEELCWAGSAAATALSIGIRIGLMM